MQCSDINCNSDSILMKIEALNIKRFFPVDWMGIVTILNEKEIAIVDEIDYCNVESGLIIDLLLNIKVDILNLVQEEKYEVLDNGAFLIIPMMVGNGRKEICVCYSIEKKYEMKDAMLLSLVTKGIWENIRLNNAIIEERNYLSHIYNSVLSSSISTDKNGIITMANKSTTEILGWIPKEIVGRAMLDVITLDNRNTIKIAMDYVLETHNVYHLKRVIQGDKFLDVSVFPLRDDKGSVIGLVALTRDVTKKLIYESEVEQLKQFAVLGQMATEVAHDIRNPLMSIRGCADILKRFLNKEPEYMEFLDPIIGEVDRINEVIEQMLLYATMTQENINTQICINEILVKCVKVIKLQKESKYIKIEKNLSDEMPLFKGNSVQLQQAFINILSNAFQAIESNGHIIIQS